jgi:hypothetical protein
VRLQHLLAEPGTDLADRLILFGIGIEAGQEESSVNVRALPFAVVSANDDEVQRITNASEVVFLELCMG